MNIKRKLGLFCAAALLGLVQLTAHAQAYQAYSIANNLRNMSGASYVVGGDDTYTTVTLPFTFTLFGQTFGSAFVSTNGFLSFTTPNQGCCTGYQLGTPAGASIGAAIAPVWTDWVDNVTSLVSGAVGSRQLVFDWNGFEYYNPGGAPGHFQAILHEGSNNVEFQYGPTYILNHQASAGIQDASGTQALNTFLGNGTSLSNTGVLISSVSPVPEPEIIAMLGVGLGFIAFARRRQLKSAAASEAGAAGSARLAC